MTVLRVFTTIACVALMACGGATKPDAHGRDAAHEAAQPTDAAPDAELDAASVDAAPADAMSPGDAGEGVVCAPAQCRSLPPACPEGQVRAIVNGCWGDCVPIDRCVCAGPDDCPDANQYTCHLHRQRCGPYVN